MSLSPVRVSIGAGVPSRSREATAVRAHVLTRDVSDETARPPERSRRNRFGWLLASYVAVTTVMLVTAVVLNRGAFTYVLDDAHIHLTIGRNLAAHGTWGVVPGVYESASSSPLWTVLLAAGWWLWPLPYEWLPLAIGFGASVWALWLFSSVEVRIVSRPDSRWNTAVLLVLPVILFLPGLTMTGMEHTLQVALTLWAFTAAWRRLERRSFAAVPWDVVAPVALLCATRFEGAFVAFGLAIALIVRRRTAEPGEGFIRVLFQSGAAALCVAGAVVVGATSAVNLAFGQYLLPNSVAAKSAFGASPLMSLVPNPAKLGPNLIALAFDWVMLGVAICLIAALWRARHRLGEAWNALALAWVVAAALHLTYAGMGWFERYQAYLIAAGIWVLLRRGEPLLRSSRGWLGAAAVLSIMFVVPVQKWAFTANAPQASHTIWGQQRVAAEFLGEYFDGRTIALHDLGEISWRHDGPIVDLAGLADFEVLQLRKAGTFDRDVVGDLLARRGAEVLVIQDGLMGNLVPSGWTRVATWRAPPGIRLTTWDETISWYAPAGPASTALHDDLAEFADSLPAGVTQELTDPG